VNQYVPKTGLARATLNALHEGVALLNEYLERDDLSPGERYEREQDLARVNGNIDRLLAEMRRRD